ncbi:MAG: helix-turn-helix transcriptional regulator, partial [Lentisphaeria bacterium]|nr:helix-turn-helix transcriptional regulator [Lentisphaeria bacterium]
MHLNPCHISKLFRQFSELSFNRTLRKFRMEWAMELLQEKTWTIKEIADQCGYSSADYVIESFKQYYGQSPG